MKIKTFTWLLVVGTTVCFLGGPAFAGKVSQVDVIKKELKGVAVPEMGAMAARLVLEAKADARESTAVAVVSAAIELKPVAAVAVVSAIARANPDVAPAVAARAASALPKDAAAIARAAAGAAPTQAGKIVLAVCKAVPTKSSEVVTAVAQLTGSTPERIITAPTPTPTLLSGLPAQQVSPSAALPPPSVGGPFTPLGGTPTQLTRTNTGAIPPGGVRYSGP